MTNSLQKFTLVTLGAALASLGSIASAAAADLSFSLSGLFEPNLARFESFTGTFSFEPTESRSGTFSFERTESRLTSYSITFLREAGFRPMVWTSEDFDPNLYNAPSLAQFQPVTTSTTIFNLRFPQPDAGFNLSFLTTNLTDAPTELDFTATSSEFLRGGLVSRAFRGGPTGSFDVIVSSATITATPPTSVPEPGTAIGLSGVALGWLLTRKLASFKSN
jgi:hypothetical protein